jgi:signal transduction histidine kinase
VLHNLISNALRHTTAAGEITVTIESLTDAVRIRVADSGEGIEPELVDHIFDRFYRTDRSRSRDTGGTGLGLAIVKAIIEAHGGYVTVSSAGLGQGSQFSIFLPQAPSI